MSCNNHNKTPSWMKVFSVTINSSWSNTSVRPELWVLLILLRRLFKSNVYPVTGWSEALPQPLTNPWRVSLTGITAAVSTSNCRYSNGVEVKWRSFLLFILICCTVYQSYIIKDALITNAFWLHMHMPACPILKVHASNVKFKKQNNTIWWWFYRV